MRSQAEHDQLVRGVLEGLITLEEAQWIRGPDASQATLEVREQVEAAETQPSEVHPSEETPPPVFADCSHYMSTASKPRVRRIRKALKW